MPSIHTLVDDVYKLLEDKGGGAETSSSSLGARLASVISDKVTDDQTPRLRPSNVGHKCLRKLWYEIHKPDEIKSFDGKTLLKFMLGNTWEEVLLFLAQEAGHDVRHQQLKVEHSGMYGSIDAIIDGCLVDVKSASPYAFDKYMEGIEPDNDPFGYVYQVNFYLHGLQEFEELSEKDVAYLFVGDKTNGRIGLAKIPKIDIPWETVVEEKQSALAKSEPPERAYTEVPFGKSGNLSLPKECNDYCNSVDSCWPRTRKFLYSDGVKRLTKVVRTPNVTEIRR